ncbi:hypothetical protein BpHYR1_045260 [Brachionus plicatilis]|uniref:Uncharacterized protein n=1 Tax=Brachionus plicatilis TaxID=10195 RepID=A0A3M7PT16_BRAPC|nr:hypothetical protein BpHYR1_045260 [Brachionus plicatilis]
MKPWLLESISLSLLFTYQKKVQSSDLSIFYGILRKNSKLKLKSAQIIKAQKKSDFWSYFRESEKFRKS